MVQNTGNCCAEVKTHYVAILIASTQVFHE